MMALWVKILELNDGFESYNPETKWCFWDLSLVDYSMLILKSCTALYAFWRGTQLARRFTEKCPLLLLLFFSFFPGFFLLLFCCCLLWIHVSFHLERLRCVCLEYSPVLTDSLPPKWWLVKVVSEEVLAGTEIPGGGGRGKVFLMLHTVTTRIFLH